MIKYFTMLTLLISGYLLNAQDKDTVEVQKIGDKYYVILPHNNGNLDSTIQATVQTATTPKKFDSHFLMVGLATIGFSNTWTSTKSGGITTKLPVTNTFPSDAFEFSPNIQWRHGDNLSVEFEPSFNPGSNPGLGVNWAVISYFAYPGIIIRGGYLVLPFGTYNKRLAAGWICKLATDPIGAVGIGTPASAPPASDWGIEMEGGLPCGNMKVSYDVSLTNGFQLIYDGSLNGGNIQNQGLEDTHIGKTVCGRFGWLPLSNSSLEFGVSGLYGTVSDDSSTQYQKVAAIMGAGDMQYIYSGPHAVFNLKGQYNAQYVTKETYANPNAAVDPNASATYSYTNLTTGWYAMASVRPVVPSKFLRNLEFVARYSMYDTPKNSGWESHNQQITAGIAYWLNWRTVFKITYENLVGSNPANENLGITDLKTIQNTLWAQFSVEF